MSEKRFQWQRLLAGLDWIFAVAVGAFCGSTLYVIRSGRFHNYWVEPHSYARNQELGLVIATASMIVGVVMWLRFKWSWWLDVAVLPLKVCAAYGFFIVWALSGGWLLLSVPVIITLHLIAMLSAWLLRNRVLAS